MFSCKTINQSMRVLVHNYVFECACVYACVYARARKCLSCFFDHIRHFSIWSVDRPRFAIFHMCACASVFACVYA